MRKEQEERKEQEAAEARRIQQQQLEEQDEINTGHRPTQLEERVPNINIRDIQTPTPFKEQVSFDFDTGDVDTPSISKNLFLPGTGTQPHRRKSKRRTSEQTETNTENEQRPTKKWSRILKGLDNPGEKPTLEERVTGTPGRTHVDHRTSHDLRKKVNTANKHKPSHRTVSAVKARAEARRNAEQKLLTGQEETKKTNEEEVREQCERKVQRRRKRDTPPQTSNSKKVRKQEAETEMDSVETDEKMPEEDVQCPDENDNETETEEEVPRHSYATRYQTRKHDDTKKTTKKK